MDTIFVENFILEGRHGHFKREHNIPQRFRADVWVQVDAQKSTKSDKMSDALDYRMIRDVMVAAIGGRSVNLVETLANKIAAGVLQDARAKQVRVRIAKIDVWGNGVPGVEIVRDNKRPSS
jgi:dihydroneopterin aldolase